jgi:YD repeat-containing protein
VQAVARLQRLLDIACPTADITSGCTVVTDPNGNPTSHAVDSLEQVTKTIDALGHTQDTGYDTLGNVVALTSNGTGSTPPASQIAYAPGTYKATSVATGGAGTSLFSYADLNVESPTGYTTPQGSALTYTYRTNGNLASIKTATGEDSCRADYHPDGSLKTYSHPNLTTSSTTDRVTTTLSYTGGNLTGVDYPAPLGDATFTVDSYSRRLTETDGRGQTTSYGYDNLDRVTSVTFDDGSSMSYGYDAVGNQTSRTATSADGGPGAVTTYTYDALNRLTAEAKPAPGPTISFSYDPVGNLRFHTGPGGVVEYQYTAVNLLAALA